MTGADVASIMNATNRDGFLEGNGIIILILFFLIFGFGGGAWGNNGNALTQAELQAGLYNQTTDANLRDIRTSICATNQNILENKYDNSLQMASISKQLCECCGENRLAIANQTNELTASMTANTQAILDKLCSQEIQNLRDQIAGYRETLNNSVQTQNITSNILNNMGRWIPYAGVNGCGCSGTYGSYYGTTIV